MTIDDGSEKLTYTEEKNLRTLMEKVVFALKSTRFWTIVVELYRIVKYGA